MGWASGSSILNEVAKAVMPLVPEANRTHLADKLIDIFEGEDCDTINECDQEDIRKAYDLRWPPEEEHV